MKALFGIILLFISASTFGQATPGTVSFSITTIDNERKYSPDHVLAIWVENATGQFVKTLQMQGVRRKKHLETWLAQSGGNIVDAVTGPTLRDHTSHTVTWNCKDTTGNVVKDGQYQIVTEYTDENRQGPIQKATFTKGARAVKLNFANETWFMDIKLVYTPGNVTGLLQQKR
jgi:hypothetical protein